MSIIDEVNEVLGMGAEFALIEAAELMHEVCQMRS